MTTTRRIVLATLAAVALPALAPAALAQSDKNWPSKPIHFVTPYPPGGSSDTITRFVGDRVAKAAENLSTDKYTISADDPGLAAIRANIRQGRVDAGPGRMTVPLPDDKTANGSVPRLLGLARTQISFDVDLVGGTIQNGVLAGAISVAAVRKNLMPLLHEQLLKLAAEGGELQRVLGRLFDLDADGTITFDEMLASNPVKLALSADVDTDGDGTADAISFGLGFRGKAVRIEHDLQ